MAELKKYLTHVKPRLDEVKDWRKKGHTYGSIYILLGIVKDTGLKYRKKYPEFEEALQSGSQILESDLAKSLYQSALGYEIIEEKTYIEKDEKGHEKKRVEKVKKTFKSITALIYALKTLNPEKWNEKHLLEHEVKGGGLPVKIVDNIPLPESLVEKYEKKLSDSLDEEKE